MLCTRYESEFRFFENAGSAHSSRGNSRLKETNVLSSRLGVKFWQLTKGFVQNINNERKPIDTMLFWRQHSSFNIRAIWISSENWFSVLAQTLLSQTIPAPYPGRLQIPVYRRAFTIPLMIQESFPSSFINKTEHRCFKDWSKLKSVPLYTLNIEIKEEKNANIHWLYQVQN